MQIVVNLYNNNFAHQKHVGNAPINVKPHPPGTGHVGL